MKNSLEALDSTLERIDKLKDRSIEIIHTEAHREIK